MTITLQRSPVTAAVLAALAGTGKPVGDSQLPPESNWIGEPMKSSSRFVPFLVASELAASRSWGPVGDTQADWQLPYLVESFGITREQCSAIADLARTAMNALRGFTFSVDDGAGELARKVIHVSLDSPGAPSAVESVDPPFYHAQDGFTAWLAKENP